jgi:hypothetical protein
MRGAFFFATFSRQGATGVFDLLVFGGFSEIAEKPSSRGRPRDIPSVAFSNRVREQTHDLLCRPCLLSIPVLNMNLEPNKPRPKVPWIANREGRHSLLEIEPFYNDAAGLSGAKCIDWDWF